MNMNKDSDEVLKFNGIDVLIKIINERSGEVGRVQQMINKLKKNVLHFASGNIPSFEG